MIVTTYTCDRCGHVQTNANQMWHILVSVSDKDMGYTHSSPSSSKKALWCRACVSAVGLAFPVKDAPAPDPAPTIEDFIREIVREERGQDD